MLFIIIIIIIFFIIKRHFFLKSISPKRCDLERASKCLIRSSPVHCHYDKMSKGIISAIGSLEKPLILPNFAHSISAIIACLGILLSIILFISSFHTCHPRLRSIEVYWLSYLRSKQTFSHQNMCTSSIEDTKHCIQIRGSYLKQKVRY